MNQPLKSKGGNDLSSIPQGPSVDPLNSQNFDLNSLFGTNTNVNQSKNKQSNVIKEVDNEEENESKPQQSKKRMIEDPETDKDIFFKSNSFNNMYLLIIEDDATAKFLSSAFVINVIFFTISFVSFKYS